MSNTVSSGIRARLEEKLKQGEAVSVKDLIEVCDLITHNAVRANNMVDRVVELEQTPAVESKEVVIQFLGQPTVTIS